MGMLQNHMLIRRPSILKYNFRIAQVMQWPPAIRNYNEVGLQRKKPVFGIWIFGCLNERILNYLKFNILNFATACYRFVTLIEHSLHVLAST